MIENLVAAWLTDASERSYEAAFGQLLVIEGFRVIQGPMHHAHEHGKDIIARDPDGRLCVFQLKGGPGKLDIPGVEDVQNQLIAATATAITHPSLPSRQVPEEVYLVTNQVATGPGQGRVRALSEGSEARGTAPIRLVEYSDLHSRFCQAQGRFFPTSPASLNTYLSIFLSDGRGPVPRDAFFRLLREALPVAGSRPRAADTQRATSAAAVLTAFALRPWLEEGNHAEVAAGWVCYCSQILLVAERLRLGRARWFNSYRLGLEEARRHSQALLEEALSGEDLLIPDPAEPAVYAARALATCGLVSALVLSERIESGTPSEHAGAAAQLIRREQPFLRVVGEVQAAEYLLSMLALEQSGDFLPATGMLLSWIRAIAQGNRPGSPTPLPDPYHSVEEILLARLTPELTELDDEDFAGSAYTLHLTVLWAAERLWRQALASMWPAISRIDHREFEPGRAMEYLAPQAEKGTLRSWFYESPKSWTELKREAEDDRSGELPTVLLDSPEFVPFLLLAMPHRLNSVLGSHLDDLIDAAW